MTNRKSLESKIFSRAGDVCSGLLIASLNKALVKHFQFILYYLSY